MNHDRLVHMANQIAREFAVQNRNAAATMTAEHIRLYWAPAMIAAIRADGAGLDPVAAAAVSQL